MAIAERLSPDEKEALLERLRAKYADELENTESGESEPEPERVWYSLGIEDVLEEEPETPDVGIATLLSFFTILEKRRPKWQRDALCQEPEYVDLPWFPERGESTAAAKDVCARCLVAEECAAYAIDIGAVGIWAGTSARSRRRDAA